MKVKAPQRVDRVLRSHRKGSCQLQGAFTLAEVLIAVCILAVAIVSLYGGFSTGFMLIDSARQELRAAQILTQKAEAIRLCSWSSLSNCPISFSERYDPRTSSGTVFAGTVSTNVATPISDTAAYKSNMCLATIKLSWTNAYGKQTVVHTRTLKTLVARYGVQNYIWGVTP